MAKKTKITLGDPGDEGPEADRRSPMERAAQKEEEAILDLLNSEQVNDATIELKRRGAAQTVFAHLAEIPAKGFSQENVKRIFGGGDYKARVRFAKSGTFGPQFDFTIDHSIPSIYPAVAKVATETQREDRTPELVTALTAAMKSAMPPPPAAPDNSLLMLLIKQQGEQMLAMHNRPAPAPDAGLAAQLAELKSELRSLKENGGGNRGGGDSFQKTLENARTLIELTGGGSGSDAPEKPDRVSELIRALAPAVAPLVQRLMGAPAADPNAGSPANGAQPLLPAGAVAGTGPERTVSANPNQPTEDMSVLVQLFLPEFKRLAMQAAAKGRDAFEWADSKLDDIDPKYHDAIFKLANAEDWSAKLFGPEVAASPHFAWLLEMRNAILTRMFVADVTNAAKTNPPVDPAAYAPAFLDRVSVTYHARLCDLLEPEDWSEIFSPYVADFDAAWLEQVRLAFEKELFEDEPAPAAEAAESEAPKKAPPQKPEGGAPVIAAIKKAAPVLNRILKLSKKKAAPKKKK